MKEVLGNNGEKELQPDEHVPAGPVKIITSTRDFWKSYRDLERRVIVLEAQVASLQLAMPKSIP